MLLSLIRKAHTRLNGKTPLMSKIIGTAQHFFFSPSNVLPLSPSSHKHIHRCSLLLLDCVNMEALSGAASGIAVVSLALQLVQSIVAIRAFIKDVKDAPKELERLVDKLEQLEALLDEARKILEQRSSLQGLPFPAPSLVIFNCLKGCEKSLQPLVDIVTKFTTPSSSHIGSTAAKLKREIKLGIKVKEIATFETRIQQDIDLLSTTLVMNTNTILWVI